MTHICEWCRHFGYCKCNLSPTKEIALNKHDVAHYALFAVISVAIVVGFLWLRRDVQSEVQTHTEIRSFGFASPK